MCKLYQANPSINLADVPGHIDELIQKALKSIYSGSGGYIDPDLWKITVDELNKAVDEEYDAGRGSKYFRNKLKYQNSVFSAYKSAHQKTTLRHLREATKSESFAEFKKRALSITGDYNVNWLREEYRTGKARMRSAKNYQDALADQDLYPNIEYMPSRAVEPREEHKHYYGTILPMDHPWWNVHMPPSVWGCQCWWRTCDTDPTPVPSSRPADVSPGLDINPGKTGRIFSNSHPYIVEMDHAWNEILRENIAAIHKRSSEELTLWEPVKATNGCVYSFDKLGQEYNRHYVVGRLLAAEGNEVQVFNHLNIDAKVNGIWNEFKAPRSFTANAFDKLFQKANRQYKKRGLRGDITFHIESGANPDIIKAIRRGLKDRISRLGKDCRIDFVHFTWYDTYEGKVSIQEILNDKLPPL